jgi:hypothetical protein
MYSTVKNEIVKNVLTEEQIERVYSEVGSGKTNYVMELFSQNITDFNLPRDISDRIIYLAQEQSGIPNLQIEEYQFARYKNTPNDGKELKPNLFPHIDMFPEPRLTFDYQIGGNSTWPLVVMEKEFELENNSALTFSGTHQPHWRVHKDFNDDEYIDMVFFHLKQVGAQAISDQERSETVSLVDSFKIKYEEEK